MVPNVADQQPDLRNERDAVGLPQLRAHGRPIVAGESGNSGSCEGRNETVFAVNFADRMIIALRDVEVAGRVELNLVRHVQ